MHLEKEHFSLLDPKTCSCLGRRERKKKVGLVQLGPMGRVIKENGGEREKTCEKAMELK